MIRLLCFPFELLLSPTPAEPKAEIDQVFGKFVLLDTIRTLSEHLYPTVPLALTLGALLLTAVLGHAWPQNQQKGGMPAMDMNGIHAAPKLVPSTGLRVDGMRGGFRPGTLRANRSG